MIVCVDVENCSHISSAFIKENSPLTDNVTEVKSCSDSYSMLLKRCIDVGTVDNNFITSTAYASTSTIVAVNDTVIHCKQMACKHEYSQRCLSFSNGMYVCMYVHL